VAIICACFLAPSGAPEQEALEQTRRALKQQGFKVDLAEFDLSTSQETRNRVAPLTAFQRMGRPFTPRGNDIQLMEPAGSNMAIVVWKEAKLKTQSDEDLWPTLRERIDEERDQLDAACDALLSGPIRFNLTAQAGMAMLLPHLAPLRNLATILGDQAVLDLHDGMKDAAWTNLLAATRLVTAWEVEPTEIPHLVRFTCAETVFDVTWQALQSSGWSDEQLSALQQEWESVDFFKGLPETAAFRRAGTAAACQMDRQRPLMAGPVPVAEYIRHPLEALAAYRYAKQERDYRNHGSYVDEKDLLLYYRDAELQLRRSIKAASWLEMRQLPGITNAVPFKSKYKSRSMAMLSVRQMPMMLQSEGRGLMGRGAEAEARRRLIIAAVALERYRLRHGAYPQVLTALVPEFCNKTPVDFMDGQPLRYRPTEDGHFVLYSVGLDCIDNGGVMPQTQGRRRFLTLSRNAPGIGPDWLEGTDIVWPRPASTSETAAHEQQEQQAREKQLRDLEQGEAIREQNMEAGRKAAVEELLGTKWKPNPDDTAVDGQRLSKVLRNDKSPGNAPRTLDELLTLKRIMTTNDPDTATFEVPISFDVVTNIGNLRLAVDDAPDEEGRVGQAQICERATNGDCLLVWDTTYDPPGRHALQAEVFCSSKRNMERWVRVKGPPLPFYSSNICQFNPFYSQFNERGATLYARLAESNGVFSIELKSPNGEHIKTLSGKTTNGIIRVHWDLLDENGNRYTNTSFQSTFNVTLPDSGRSTTMSGP